MAFSLKITYEDIISLMPRQVPAAGKVGFHGQYSCMGLALRYKKQEPEQGIVSTENHRVEEMMTWKRISLLLIE